MKRRLRKYTAAPRGQRFRTHYDRLQQQRPHLVRTLLVVGLGLSSLATPAAEWIMVVSSAISRSSGGSRPGNRCASIVLPDPGGPIMSR